LSTSNDLKGNSTDQNALGAKDAPKAVPNQPAPTVVSQKPVITPPAVTQKRTNGGQGGSATSRPGQFYHQYKNNKLLVQA
jgi:hypothetical protein